MSGKIKRFVSALLLSVFAVVLTLGVTPAFAADGADSAPMSEEFAALLTDGKLVLKCVDPMALDCKDDEEFLEEFKIFVNEVYFTNNANSYMDEDTFNEDFTQVELTLRDKQESHMVDIVWDYDPDVLKVALPIIEKLREYQGMIKYFHVSDLDAISYRMYSANSGKDKDDGAGFPDPDYVAPGLWGGEYESLTNFSSELKSILGNKNFRMDISTRAGGPDILGMPSLGPSLLVQSDTIYYIDGYMGSRMESVIYVPEDTGDTKEELAAAAQKRIDDYLGEGKITVTTTNYTYRDLIAEQCDTERKAEEDYLADLREQLAAELAKDESLQDKDFVSRLQNEISSRENWIDENSESYKQERLADFDEKGYDGYGADFMKKAAGEFIFDAEIVGTGSSFKFVVTKDNAKYAVVPTYESVDAKTEVSVSSESSSIPLDTLVEVEKLTEGDRHDKITGALDVKDDETFDIKLHSDTAGKYISKLDNGKFEVKIPVPEKFRGKNLTVYYVDEDGNATEHATTVKDGYAVFETDHMSVYTLVEKVSADAPASPGESSSSPQTGNGWVVPLLAVLFLASGAAIAVLSVPAKRKNSSR